MKVAVRSLVLAVALMAAPAVHAQQDAAPAAEAVQSQEATAYDVGSKVEDFSLTNAATGENASLASLKGEKGVVLVFYNQECPFVQEVHQRISDFHKAYKDKGLPVVAIDAGDNNSAEAVKSHTAQVSFPILLNPDSKIASRFGATRTPEVFLINAEGTIVYHGAFDNGKLQGENATRQMFVQTAADSLLDGKVIEAKSTKAFGCTLKYAKGAKALPRMASSESSAQQPG